MASICDHWMDKTNGERGMSAAIITTEPCEKLQQLYDRLTVMIPEGGLGWVVRSQEAGFDLAKAIFSNSDAVNFNIVGFEISGTEKKWVNSETLILPRGHK